MWHLHSACVVCVAGAGQAGCFREVAALHSDHLTQVPL